MDPRQHFQKMRRDPAAFRDCVVIDADGGPVRFGECMDDWQRNDFEALDPAWQHVVGNKAGDVPYRAWLERPRGHSKTLDLAVMATWALFASDRCIKGVAAAADKDQAKLLRDAIRKLVLNNQWLGQLFDVQQYRVVNVKTESTLDIISSDAPTSYGITPDFVICDEITHWQSRDLWDSLISSAAKRRHCLLLVITNAGFTDSWQFEIPQFITRDPAWYFSRLDGPRASWITPERLAEQERLLPHIAYRRLWLNEWSSGCGDALSDSDIVRSLTLSGPTTAPEDGWVYVAGLDLGLSRDASALVVIGKHIGHCEVVPRPPRNLSYSEKILIEAGLKESPVEEDEEVWHAPTARVKLIDVCVWHPTTGHKVDLDNIERTILALHRTFGFTLSCDPWQSEHLQQRLRRESVVVESVPFVGQNLVSMCSTTLEAFNSHTIELYNHEQLLKDLRALRIEEKSYGVRLNSPRTAGGHGDCATGLALALHAARDVERHVPQQVQGELLCFP